MHCKDCNDDNCILYNQDITMYQRCLHCQFGAEPANAYCELCITGYCGFLERIDL